MKAASFVLVALVVAGCIAVESPTVTDGSPSPTVSASAFPGATSTARPTTISTPRATATPLPTTAPTPAPPSPTPSATPQISTAGACGDDAYSLSGDRWDEPYEWYISVKSIPPNMTLSEVTAVARRAFDNITQARNDCGLPDNVSAEAIFIGSTDEVPCALTNAHNVVGFGRVPRRLGADAIAYMCPFHDTNGDLFAADIVLNTKVDWALSEADCSRSDELLEPTLTHEAGHVFGLGHVGERRHGDLTMSTRSNGACRDEESTLGLGDILALEALYWLATAE
jgi:hypothetical protein